MKYRYAFDIGNYEYSQETILLHDERYTKEEFNAICKECIKECIVTKLEMLRIPVMTDDGEILEVVKYEDTEKLSVWMSDNYTNLDYIRSDVFKSLKSRGFEIESLPLEASFCANEYTYIRETLSDELVRIFEWKQTQNECVVISDMQSSDLCDYLESNAKTIEEAFDLIPEWLTKNT